MEQANPEIKKNKPMAETYFSRVPGTVACTIPVCYRICLCCKYGLHQKDHNF